MNKLIIICVETKNKDHDTDYTYISKVLNTRYSIKSNSSIKVAPIYFNGKGNYNKRSVLKKINEIIQNSKAEEKHIIYCVDTDKYETNLSQSDLNDDIKNFCNTNNYYFVWFCHNIEEVFLCKNVPSNKKIEEAKKFNRQNELDNALIKRLSATHFSKNSSNMLCIFDKLFEK